MADAVGASEGCVFERRFRKKDERANWLGTDETHYLRKWPDKDLKDLVSKQGSRLRGGLRTYERAETAFIPSLPIISPSDGNHSMLDSTNSLI